MQHDSGETHEKITSPFSQSHVSPPSTLNRKPNYLLWIVLAVLLIVIGSTAGIMVTKYLGDNTRTLESFPVSKYFEGPNTLNGSRFRGDLRVETDLGYKEGLGHLMLFSTPDDSRPIAVMIPASINKDLYFTKGQSYLAELEVKEGGLIYANSCHKN